MLNGVRITFALIALCISIYGFFTGNRDIMPYMFFFLGLMAFTVALGEIKQDRKSSGLLAFMAGAGALFLSLSELFR
ncbi:YczI family protein [Bacillus mobilis]|uniref:YczI family protein n=1 Tax=Bacillus mobilis TaxID=2026190 RepID=UPI002E1A90F5|nr:YczI family protein [Bacillus mobilis]MED0997783.1 YczI family protein [Bacillus mobilis]MED1000366.1 YczI family protein [Bacillus mobilis]